MACETFCQFEAFGLNLYQQTALVGYDRADFPTKHGETSDPLRRCLFVVLDEQSPRLSNIFDHKRGSQYASNLVLRLGMH